MCEESSKVVEQPHSVEVSINAKGLFSGKVKTYGASPEQARDQTLRLAKELEVIIQEKNKL